MNQTPGTSPIWNVMLAVTILAGGVACFMAVKREDFFPSEYSKHEPHNDSTQEVKHNGTAHTIEKESIVEKEKVVHEDTSVTDNGAQFVLVAGSFLSEERANHFRESFAAKFPKSEVVPFLRDNKQFYHVLVGRAKSREAILDMQREISANGFKDCWFYQIKDSQ
jgi:cell division protein FtsN